MNFYKFQSFIRSIRAIRSIRIILFLIVFFGVLGLAKMSSAATYTCGTDGVDNSCTPSGLQTLISNATDGDTINIASGTHNWTATVLITKRITINGGGTCNNCGDAASPTGTWLVTLDSGSNNVPFFCLNVGSAGTGISRITGLKFYGGIAFQYQRHADCANALISMSRSNITQFRIDNNYFENTYTGGYTASLITTGLAYGLIDNNFFDHHYQDLHIIYVYRTAPTENGYDWYGTWGRVENPCGSQSWTEPDDLGTASFVFIEDNSFIHRCNPGSGYLNGPMAVDGDAGGRSVVRYNYMQNAVVGGHDLTGGSGVRASRAQEIYNNIMDWNECAGNPTFSQATLFRGGVTYIHNNNITDYQTLTNVMYQTRGNAYPPCSSSTGIDGQGPPDGYRCLDSPGTGQASGATQATVQPQSASPCRIWSNTLSLTTGNIIKGYGSYFVQNVDWFLSADESAKPAGYTPYTYPHPLQAGGTPPDTTPPAAPSGVTVI